MSEAKSGTVTKFFRPPASEVPKPSAAPKDGDTVCGILQATGTAGYYNETGFGCVTIYLYDDNGNFAAAITHQCVPGNHLQINQKYGIGCGC